jgi:hypothetical protein
MVVSIHVIFKVPVSNKTICNKKKKSKGSKIVRVGARAGDVAVIRIYGSAEPEPKEIFTAPQHCWQITCSLQRKGLLKEIRKSLLLKADQDEAYRKTSTFLM